MGGGPKKDKKFIQKLMKQIKDGNDIINIVNDKDGTPTYTHDFAITVKKLIQEELWGLYNCVCDGQTSRIEVAKELLSVLNIQDKVRINEVNSDFFKEIYYAERPPSERLVNKKLKLRKINLMNDWKSSLKKYIENYYQNYL